MINGIWLNLKCKNLNNSSSKWQTKFGSTKDFNHSGSKMKTSKKKREKGKKQKEIPHCRKNSESNIIIVESDKIEISNTQIHDLVWHRHFNKKWWG